MKQTSDSPIAKVNPAPAAGSVPAPAPEADGGVYIYQSAGMAERKGKIPVWLWVVAVLLTIWGIYYLIAYWNPPAAG